jgi:hypothetical protein
MLLVVKVAWADLDLVGSIIELRMGSLGAWEILTQRLAVPPHPNHPG